MELYRYLFLPNQYAIKQFFLAILVMLCLLGCDGKKRSVLLDEFRSSNAHSVPEISVHRGGKGILNYPENSLETLQYLNKRIDAIYEIDISETKDGQLVLFHDTNLERTTTGYGLLRNKTQAELEKLVLKDDYNNVTVYKIPLFKSVLNWAKKNQVVLTVDVKRGVPFSKVLEAINETETQNNCILITYTLDQALEVYELAPNLMISVSARNNRELDALLQSKLPTQNMIAFTGTRLSSARLYERLAAHDIISMLGTLGNLDRRAAVRGDALYKDWKKLGINIIATDRPLDVYEVLKSKKQ